MLYYLGSYSQNVLLSRFLFTKCFIIQVLVHKMFYYPGSCSQNVYYPGSCSQNVLLSRFLFNIGLIIQALSQHALFHGFVHN